MLEKAFRTAYTNDRKQLRYLLQSFFLYDPATPEIYTLSLHDALPILANLVNSTGYSERSRWVSSMWADRTGPGRDRKSTRLNSSHTVISYAVFCLKKKINEDLAPRVQSHPHWVLFPIARRALDVSPIC